MSPWPPQCVAGRICRFNYRSQPFQMVRCVPKEWSCEVRPFGLSNADESTYSLGAAFGSPPLFWLFSGLGRMHVLSVWLPRSCLDSKGAARTSSLRRRSRDLHLGAESNLTKLLRQDMASDVRNAARRPTADRSSWCIRFQRDERDGRVAGTHRVLRCGKCARSMLRQGGRLDPGRHYLSGLHLAGPTSVFPTFGNDGTQFWWLRL